jgi:hypothetical protein
MQPDIITIIIPPGMWLDVRGDGTRLTCVLSINGTLLHLDAIDVTYVGNNRTQVATSIRDEEDLALLSQFGHEGPFETTEIKSQRYVLVATPFTGAAHAHPPRYAER